MSDRIGDPFVRAVWRWEPWQRPGVVHVSLGADRYEEHAEKPPPRRPVGFAPPKAQPAPEPLTWQGDNA